MKYLFLVFLAGCASLKPGPAREKQPLLQRGWAYVEPERSFLGIDAGVTPVSYSGPVVVGEKIIFGSERFGVTAINKHNGRVLWRKPIGDGVAALPFVFDGKIAVGSEAGQLHLLDAEGGREIWSVSLGMPVHGSMTMAAGRLFVATADEALHALDPASGKVLWTYRRPSFSGTSIRGGGNPSLVGGRIWLGFSDGTLVSLNPDTGALESEKTFRDNIKFMDIDAKVIGWKDGLLVSTYDGKLRHLGKDGNLIWEFPAGGARAPIVTGAGTIFFPSSDGNVYAISGATGKELWRYSLRRGVPTGMSLLQRDGKPFLAVADSEEKLFVLNAADGKQLDQFSFGRGSGSYAPVVADEGTNHFYVLSSYSRVYQFRLNL